MKFLVVAACVLLTVQALTDEQREKLKEHSTACAKSTGVDPEAIANAKKGTFSDDEKFKDYLFCVSKKIGFQNEAGEIQKDVVKQKATVALKDEKLVDEIIKKCAVVKDTPQNTAFEVAKCYYENNAKHSSLV
nr:odorant binding protein 17 [Harmonia axyridis]QTE76116.1 odorant binding protein 8 [Harmonia axyridis]